MKKSVSGGMPNPATDGRSDVGNRKNLHIPFHSDVLKLPAGAFTEAAYIAGCPKYEIRARLRKLSDDVRWGRLRRILIGGIMWYVPVRRHP